MLRAYSPVLLKELRSNFWSFSIVRAILAASTTAPAFGPTQYFSLPPDFIMLAPPDQTMSYTFGYSAGRANSNNVYNDFKIEAMPNNAGSAIVSSQPGPIYIRYVSSAITEAQFDADFAEALSCSLAVATCEELTQSNTKAQAAAAMYKEIMAVAKKRNSYELPPVAPPVDPYLLVRL